MITSLHLGVVMALTEVVLQLKIDRQRDLPVVDSNSSNTTLTLTEEFEDFVSHLDLELPLMYETEVIRDQSANGFRNENRNSSLNNSSQSHGRSYSCGYDRILLASTGVSLISALRIMTRT